ncbi:hypothetical protein DNTS_014274 [Danionella cerebrum]|uniref:Ig-like domain-containing protein n=1 Tax=Danionella cerebrum TaxID=2873325 RepID=A0A553R412_9TELE|nr:hypothetical protein DNTS_014274 [Danionella translucida]
MAFKVTTLVLLLHLSGSRTLEEVTVKCTNICALMETNAQLVCHYDFDVKTAYWFTWKQRTNWKDTNEPEDLTLDMDYSGRVNQTFNKESSTLTISDLRGQDSGEYQLIFIMEDGVKRFASAAVNLTATDLQVSPTDPRGNTVKLACDTSCDLTVQPQKFYWRKNGQYMPEEKFYSRFITVPPAGSYSCSLYYLQSSPVFLRAPAGMWLTPHEESVLWKDRQSRFPVHTHIRLVSLLQKPSGIWFNLETSGIFKRRIGLLENKLRIKELKMDDSGQYQFRIITDKAEGKFSGSPGVILTVTDLQVTSHPDATADGKVILSCATRCTLSEKHTFIWYKNGRRVTEGFTKANKLYLDSINSEELQEFSCVVADEERTALRNAAVVFCVILSLALTGALWYSCRRFTCFKTHSAEMEHVQDDTVYNNISPEMKGDAENQDMHYSTIEFETHPPSTVKQPAPTTETENVCYAAVMVR